MEDKEKKIVKELEETKRLHDAKLVELNNLREHFIKLQGKLELVKELMEKDKSKK